MLQVVVAGGVEVVVVVVVVVVAVVAVVVVEVEVVAGVSLPCHIRLSLDMSIAACNSFFAVGP